jgi:hypothetical protein
VISKLQLVALPDMSVAVVVTVVVPTGKNEPDAGEETFVTPEQVSAALGANVTSAPH